MANAYFLDPFVPGFLPIIGTVRFRSLLSEAFVEEKLHPQGTSAVIFIPEPFPAVQIGEFRNTDDRLLGSIALC